MKLCASEFLFCAKNALKLTHVSSFAVGIGRNSQSLIANDINLNINALHRNTQFIF